MEKDSPITKTYLFDQRKSYALLSGCFAAIALGIAALTTDYAIAGLFASTVPALWLFYAHTVSRVRRGVFGTRRTERADIDRWLERNNGRRIDGVIIG